MLNVWVAHWCPDVSWVWRILNRNAAYYSKTCATTGCYTTKALEYYSRTYDVPNCYTEDPKYSAPSYTTKGAEYYTTKGAEYYTTKGAEYYTTKGVEYYSTAYAAPSFFTDRILHYNPRFPQLLYRGSQVLHQQGSRVLHHKLLASATCCMEVPK
jgi:hypothetical protein